MFAKFKGIQRWLNVMSFFFVSKKKDILSY